MSVTLVAPTGIGEVQAGDDLAQLVVTACAASGIALQPGDVVCVSSKIVSKSLGLTATDRDAAIAADSRAVVAIRHTARGLTSVVRAAAGPVMAAAGVDESNTGPGGGVLRLPGDPDGEARRLRRAIAAAAGLGTPGSAPAVIVTDTAGRPWRDGQTDFALGVAGLDPVDDARGRRDADGRLMDVTVRALADEIAAAADLVKGKVGGTPVAVLRGMAALVTVEDGPGAAVLVRDPSHDWFGLGDVEAVHAALGVSAGAAVAMRRAVGAPPAQLPGSVADSLHRAVAVARLGRGAEVDAAVTDPVATVAGQWQVSVHGDPVSVGRLVERVVTAAAAERLMLTAGPDAPGPAGASPGAVTWRVTADGDDPTQDRVFGVADHR